MTPQSSTVRSLLAVGAGLAFTLAACGSGDDGATDTTVAATVPDTDPAPSTTGSTADGMPAMQPAAITFDAQAGDGTTITVASVDMPAAGFIAVHSDGGGSPGPVIGTSALLSPGATTDVEITLDSPLTDDTDLYPMVHIDTNVNGVYEFGEIDGVDGPGLTAGGDVAVVSATVMVDGGGDAGSNDAGDTSDRTDAATTGGDTITIADFTFDGVTDVVVGTTVVVTNTDAAPHTWTAVDGAFDSGSLGQGETFEFTFDTPGTFEYFCNFHPSMSGTITVTG